MVLRICLEKLKVYKVIGFQESFGENPDYRYWIYQYVRSYVGQHCRVHWFQISSPRANVDIVSKVGNSITASVKLSYNSWLLIWPSKKLSNWIKMVRKDIPDFSQINSSRVHIRLLGWEVLKEFLSNLRFSRRVLYLLKQLTNITRFYHFMPNFNDEKWLST